MSNTAIAEPAKKSTVKDFDRFYQNSQPANFIRGIFFQLAATLQMDTMMDTGDQTATTICERYSIQNSGLEMDLIIKGSKPLGMWNSTILDSCTYASFNKNLNSLIECLPDTNVIVVVEAMQKLMQLYRQDHRFECDFDDGVFTIKFEHRPSKFFTELTITVAQ